MEQERLNYIDAVMAKFGDRCPELNEARRMELIDTLTYIEQVLLEAVSAEHAGQIYGDEQFAADCERYLNDHPNKIDQVQARRKLVELRPRLADPEFNATFFEKLDDHKACAAWQKGKYGSPYWMLHNSFWEDTPLGVDGRPAIGKLQRERLKAERRNKLPITGNIAAALSMPAPPVVDTRSTVQISRDNLVEALIDPNATPELIQKRRECFLAFGGKPPELRAIEAECAMRMNAGARQSA